MAGLTFNSPAVKFIIKMKYRRHTYSVSAVLAAACTSPMAACNRLRLMRLPKTVLQRACFVNQLSIIPVLLPQADIINRGLSGYNSRWGLLVLPHTLADFGCLSPQQQTQQQQQKAATRQQLWGSLRGPLSHAQQQQQGSTTCSVQLLLIWYGANDLVNKNGPE